MIEVGMFTPFRGELTKPMTQCRNISICSFPSYLSYLCLAAGAEGLQLATPASTILNQTESSLGTHWEALAHQWVGLT